MKAVFLTGVAYLTVAAGSAGAQVAEVPPQSTGSTTTPADTGNGGQSTDIVVTAQKRSEALSRVPASIAAVSGDTIASRGITSVIGLENQVPNIAIGRSYDGAVDLTIRGISSSDNTNKGDPAVALNIDGVYVGRPQAAGAAFYDLERVEVLRGPQGTLYGRNANAGAINIISRRPTDRLEAGGDISFGNYNFLNANSFLNVPITDGIAIRSVVSYQRHDGFSHTGNATNGFDRDQDDLDNFSGRMLLRARISDRATLLAGIDGSIVRGAGAAIFPIYADGGIPYYRRKTAYVEGDRKDYTVNGFAQFDYDFGGVGLTYLYGHRYLHLDDILDLGGGTQSYAPPVWGFNASNTAQDSHELRLTSDNSGPLKWVIGGYYFHERGTDTNFDIRVADIGRIIQYLQGPTINRSKAVFGQATYSVLPHTRITGGIRSTWDHKSRSGVSVLGPLSGAPAAIQGVEGEAQLRITSDDRINLSAGWLDAEYDRYITPSGISLADRHLDKAPDVTITANGSHDWHFGPNVKLTAYVGTRYSSSYTVSDPGTLTAPPRFFRQKPTTRSEVSLTLAGAEDRWSVQVYGRNLENHNTVAGLVQNGGVYYIGFNEPRLYGVKGAVRF